MNQSPGSAAGGRIRAAALAAIVASGALAGCSDARSATTANFEAVVRADFAKRDERLCIAVMKALNVNALFPYTESENATAPDLGGQDSAPDSTAQLLAGVGLLSISNAPSVRHAADSDSRAWTEKFRTYALTAEGARYAYTAEDSGGAPYTNFCYGTKTFDAVTNFTTPAAEAGMMTSQVTYTFHVANLAPWASDPNVVAAFSQADGFGDPAPEYYSDASPRTVTMTLVQTNNGWESR